MSETIELTRDCEAIQIPYGNTITARAGTKVSVMQQLGDTFTVRSEQGYLMRIAGHDSDAMGLPPPAPVTQSLDTTAEVKETQLWEVLKSCYDPEIPANIVDLGLIYTVRASRREANAGTDVAVEMTLTAPGCGMGQVLKDDVARKISAVPGVANVVVDLVFDPPWEPALMSESARLQLGMM